MKAAMLVMLASIALAVVPVMPQIPKDCTLCTDIMMEIEFRLTAEEMSNADKVNKAIDCYCKRESVTGDYSSFCTGMTEQKRNYIVQKFAMGVSTIQICDLMYTNVNHDVCEYYVDNTNFIACDPKHRWTFSELQAFFAHYQLTTPCTNKRECLHNAKCFWQNFDGVCYVQGATTAVPTTLPSAAMTTQPPVPPTEAPVPATTQPPPESDSDSCTDPNMTA